MKMLIAGIGALFLGGVLWFFFGPTGPLAKAFCDEHPTGSRFDRTRAFHEMAQINGSYITRITFAGGQIGFHGSVVVLEEGVQFQKLTLDEAIALAPNESEVFKVTSTGFTKRSCEIHVNQSQVEESKTWLWE